MMQGTLVKVLVDRLGWRGNYGRIEYMTVDGLLSVRLLNPDTVTLILHPQECVEVVDIFPAWFQWTFMESAA